MLTETHLNEMVSLLEFAVTIAILGLHVTGVSYLGHQIQSWVSGHTRVDSPDPTAYFRLWRQLFDKMFHPFGEQAVHRDRDTTVNRMMYELVIGAVAIVALIGLYLLTSSAIIGGMVLSYYSVGSIPDLSMTFDYVAATCILILAVTAIYARERSKEVVAANT